MIRSSIHALLGSAALAALAMPVAAQTADDAEQTAATPDAASPSAQPSATSKDQAQGGDVIVTAQRRAQRLQDVPQSITVQTGAELERQQVNTIADLSRVAPSLEIQQAPGQSVGGGGQIRGIGTQSFQQGAVGSVGVVVDGVSQGNANIADLFDIDRVEVLKGPQGTLFGLTTSAGVINISTTAPRFGVFAVRARTELSGAGNAGSEFGRQLIQGVVNIPIADNAALRVSGNVNLTQGVNRNAYTNRNDPHRTYGGRARLRWEPTDRVSVNLIGDYTRVRDDGVDFFVLFKGDTAAIPAGNPAFPPGTISLNTAIAACGVTPSGSNRSYCTRTPAFTRSETWGTSLQLDFEAEPFTVTSISSFRHQDSNQTLNIFRLDPLLTKVTLPPVPGQIIDGPKPIQSDLFTQELRLASPTGSRIEYTAGLFYSRLRQHNDPEQVRITIPIPFAPAVQTFVPGNDADISDDQLAGFGQATIHVVDGFNIIAGARYTVERLGVDVIPVGATTFTRRPFINTDNFSWKLGAQYEFNRNLTAYGTVSRGYKGAQIALGDPTSATSVPTIIRPEIPTNYEAGIKANAFEGRLGLDLSGFYNDVKDYQGQQCIPAAGGGIQCVPQNISGVHSRGVEANVFGRPADRISLNLGAIWNKVTYPNGFAGQDGTALAGEQLVNAPEWKVTATGEVNQPIGGLEAFVAGDAIYKSSIRYAATTNPLASYEGHVTIGGRLGLRSGGDGRFSIAAFVRNLTNEHEPVYRLLGFPDGTQGAGQILTTQSFRQVGLQLEGRF